MTMSSTERAEAFFEAVCEARPETKARMDFNRPRATLLRGSPAAEPVSLPVEPADWDDRDVPTLFPDDTSDYPVDGAGLERELRARGIEALALYLPYTFWGADWGIYFNVSRIYDLAGVLARDTGYAPAHGLVPA